MDNYNVVQLQGASTEDIQYHYDLSRDFYRLWLDDTMTYSCAMFADGDDLEEAQLRKLDYHIAQAEISPHHRVLDIGCGWGSLMSRVVSKVANTECVGLTLSSDQKSHIDEAHDDRIDVFLKSWNAMEEVRAFDAVVSIGAMEHFAGPSLDAEEKTAIYRSFFKTVGRVLRPGRCLSLQTIVFDRMQDSDFPTFITEKIFPGSILPRLGEIVAASDRILSLLSLRNDSLDYARTCRAWVKRIKTAKPQIVDLVGADKANEYVQYLRMSAVAFERGEFGLMRMKFRLSASN